LFGTKRSKDRVEVLLNDLRQSKEARGAAVNVDASTGGEVNIIGSRAGIFRLGIDLASWAYSHESGGDGRSEMPEKSLAPYVDIEPSTRLIIAAEEPVPEDLSDYCRRYKKAQRASSLMAFIFVGLPLLTWLLGGLIGIAYLVSRMVAAFA